ncbi:hypothetical protein [Halorussus pelagicus]|uniref:hypothetical protein n=1 Tax=Halorussus pelagicus TaxID=2505977 RepID=UPI000FFB93D4|nr:hypothetical protein [Halorussus pelagicus]
MSRRALAAVVVVLALAGAGVVFAGGIDFGDAFNAPADERTATGATTASEVTSGAARQTTAADSATESTDETDETPTTTMTNSEYAFEIESIESCGNTCRDVTARLTNSGGETREDVTVTTAMLADGEVLWSGNETVGTLEPGESHVSTERIEVGFSGGLQISANDGYVAIVAVVESADGTSRFAERRKVT